MSNKSRPATRKQTYEELELLERIAQALEEATNTAAESAESEDDEQ